MAVGRVPWNLLLGLVLAATATLTSPGVGRADDDPVAERAAITYRLDPAKGRIDATAKVRFTNRIPSQRSGNRIRRYYLDRWGPIAIPADATRVKVRPRSVKVQRMPTGSAYDNLVFSFPRIYNGSSVSFTLTFTIRGDGTSQTGTVVTDAYSHFCWPGQPVDTGPISLLVPRRTEAVTQGSAVRVRRSGSQLRLTARASDLAGFYACTDVYDPSLMVRRDLVSPRGHAVTVEGLPGHEAWLEATSQSIAEALAGVEAIVGAPLPGDDPVRVREVPSGALQGYAGDFDPASGVVRVGSDGASVGLLSHELSHAWFNAGTLATNWLWEGLAEWSSRETVGFPCDQPVEPPFEGRPHLADWQVLQSANATFEEQQTVQWQYEAACAIQGQVAAAVGSDRMRQVIGVLLSGDSPYDRLPETAGEPTAAPSVPPAASPSPSPLLTATEPPRLPPGAPPATPAPRQTPVASAESPVAPSPMASTGVVPATAVSATGSSKRRTRPVDWRQWLDIVDEVGLVPARVEDLTFAEDLLVRTGVIRRAAVEGRAEARAAFHELQALAPSGVTPALVRRDLDRWEFEAADRDGRLARQVATRIAALAQGTDQAVAWAAYEAATSRAALQALRDSLP
ncbi:MAG: hypothetical protein U0667_02980 [Chloroflexota bacterium]